MKRYSIFSLVIASSILVCGCGDESTQALSIKAESAYASGDYTKALKFYEKVHASEGESATTYINLGVTALGAQDYEFARDSAERAKRLAMTAQEAELATELLGMVAEARKDIPQAIRYYRELRHAATQEIRLRAHSRLARIYTEGEKYDAAFALLLSAYSAQLADGLTTYNLGKLCTRPSMQLRAAALDYFRQAERLLPDMSEQKRDAKDMIARLEANLKRLQPLPPSGGNAQACEASLKKARAEKKAKRWRSAEQHAAKAMTADPTNVEAALEYAEICIHNNNTTAAKKAYDAALVLQPNNVEIRKKAASLALNTKRFEDALTILRPALVINATDTNLVYSMAYALAGQKKYVEARIWGEYMLELNPKLDAAYHKWVQSLPEE